MIDISNRSKPAVLAALYNASRPLGIGAFHFDDAVMEETEADLLLKQGTYFDYLKGRVMKVDMAGDSEIDPFLYDRDNGPGAAQRAVDSVPVTDSN